jgi:ABC-type transport system involved in Fe-S cluster assembly fused permease/ATPase subunit
MGNHTCIIIAHCLIIIRYAHEIILLQKGEIVERGTNDSLFTQNGFINDW